MKISDKQIESVLSLPGEKRYSYFIKMVADQRKAWGLYADGWALAGADDGRQVFPLWPAREYAEKCASGAWAGHTAREIDLDSVLEELIPSLKSNRTSLGIFYTPTNKGVLPDFAQFEDDLKEELSRIE